MNLCDVQMRAIERGMAAGRDFARRTSLAQGKTGGSSQQRRAVVALVVRRPSLRAAAVGVPLQLLFILRAARPGSSHRWSGQVGLPGGRVEAGETDEEAVVREAREEVGIALDRPGAYRQLGEVAQRRVQGAGGGGGGERGDGVGGGDLVLCCHVYEQLLDRPAAALATAAAGDERSGTFPAIKPSDLQAAEVAACGWAPLTALTGDACLRPLQWPPPVVWLSLAFRLNLLHSRFPVWGQ